MVEVFRTNIKDKVNAAEVVKDLKGFLPAAKVNFDLHDCDNILRIEGQYIPIPKVRELLQNMGFYCEVLE
jgi:hypothetical protein